MPEPKYKVGDRFEGPGSIREILAVVMAASGVPKYWADDDGDRDPSTYNENQVNRWKKIEPFFEIGKIYLHPINSDSVHYKVTAIGTDPNGDLWATVERYRNGEFSWMTVFDRNEFQSMREV